MAIIAVPFTLLLPAVQAARDSSSRIKQRMRTDSSKSRGRGRVVCAACLTLAVCAGGLANEYELDDPAEPWRTARAGLTEQVMPPYTPLVCRGNQVRCLGRQYDLSGHFPTAVVSQDLSLLTRPIALRIKRGGQWQDAKSEDLVFTQVAAHQCEYSGASDVGDLRIVTSSLLEYDGLVRTGRDALSQAHDLCRGLAAGIRLRAAGRHLLSPRTTVVGGNVRAFTD